jgi:hypothetical protein
MLLCMTADDAELETCEEALIWLAQDRPGAGVGDALDELRLAVRLGRSDQAVVLLPDSDLPPRSRSDQAAVLPDADLPPRVA